jgi:hypothetical protein
MQSFNKDLDKQFKKLGFPNYFKMLQTASHHEDFVFLTTSLSELSTKSTVENDIHFSFIVTYPENQLPYYIEYITASIEIIRDQKEPCGKMVEKTYWCENGPFPTKDKMVSEVLETLKIKEINKKFKLRGDLKENKSCGKKYHSPGRRTGV